jgi:hypothetical protein
MLAFKLGYRRALLRLRRCGELATRPGAGVTVSQADRPTGPLQPLRLSLGVAIHRKLGSYGSLLEALRSYIERGWQVRILPWVVGVRGTIDAKSVSEILDFLQVAQDRRAKIVEDVVIESVKALHSLHQIRYQALRLNEYHTSTRSNKIAAGGKLAADQQGTFHIDPSTSCTRKRRRYANKDYGETQLRWTKMASVLRGGS